MTLLCGDFFHLSADDCQTVKAVYDRAALVALPLPMRVSYARHLLDVLPKGCQILLISMESPHDLLSGPPFSVDQAEIERLFAPAQSLTLLHHEDGLRKGMLLIEKVFLIRV
jgi:thiopurine S-methyltransferase